MKFLAAIAVASIGFAAATCPNLCSGHGNCGLEDRCTCHANWQGADCSERVCNFGLAWVDAPTAASTAHWYAECSNKGICDRTTGECACFEGYTGKGCRRSTCPNDCSGHGTCYYIDQLTPSGDRGKLQVQYGDLETNPTGSFTYGLWDAKKVQGCVCDPYYEGADCSLRQCPRGDNVLTQSKNLDQIQTITFTGTLAASSQFTITYTDLFGGKWETRPIATAALIADIATNIKAALKALPNAVIPDVDTSGAGSVVSVTFKDDANTGEQNALTVNWKGCNRAGCSPKYLGISWATNVVVAPNTVAVASLQEKAICSEHGLCDSATGLCKCFHGYYNLDCSAQTILV
jgi:hypothetical protein